MAIPSIWQERLAGWQASKLSAVAFCEGKDFSVHSLRTWRGRQLEAERAAAPRVGAIKLARVRMSPPPPRLAATTETSASGVRIAVGSVSIVVDRGFDRATLIAVVDAVGRSSGAGR